MTNFDIESLFLNIPLRETVHLSVELLFNDKLNIDGFTITGFHELLTVTIFGSLVLFDGEYYKQIDGVAIDSLLEAIFANIFPSYFEQIWIQTCLCEFKPVIYKRYADESFLLFRSKGDIEKFLCYLNCQHYNIKFTFEIEGNNSMSLLNIKIRKVKIVLL